MLLFKLWYVEILYDINTVQCCQLFHHILVLLHHITTTSLYHCCFHHALICWAFKKKPKGDPIRLNCNHIAKMLQENKLVSTYNCISQISLWQLNYCETHALLTS